MEDTDTTADVNVWYNRSAESVVLGRVPDQGEITDAEAAELQAQLTEARQKARWDAQSDGPVCLACGTVLADERPVAYPDDDATSGNVSVSLPSVVYECPDCGTRYEE